jgi:peroxiredoxin
VTRCIKSLVAVLALSAILGTTVIASQKGGSAPVAIGSPAPAWTLQNYDGKTHNLADFAGKIVVLEWFNDQCPYVVKHYREGHMNATAAKYADKGVVWLAVNSSSFTSNDKNKAIAGEWKINRPILNDSTGATGRAYGAKTTPHMYIIDKAGNLAYMGAIDSNSSANTADVSGATNHVVVALDEMLAGKPVSTPETKAYGCSVKYAK